MEGQNMHTRRHQNMARITAAALVIMLGALSVQVTPVNAAGTTVTWGSPDWLFINDNGTTGDWSAGFAVGPGVPPAGAGSLHIALNSASAGIIFGAQKYVGTPLASIQALSYSTYTNASPKAMAFQINYDDDLTTSDPIEPTWHGRLVYEPYMNGTVSNGAWQNWDMINGGSGMWWASGPPVNGTCPQASPCTWNALIAAYPNIGIRNDAWSLIQFKAGSNWNGFSGYADNLSIQIGGNTDTYDFEPPSTVYVDDDWVGTTIGADPDGAGPAVYFGGDAYATVQEGVNAVLPTGTVNVAAGTYTEQVTITKALTLAGANEATTIVRAPNSLAICFTTKRPIICVNGADANINTLTVDGAGKGNANAQFEGIGYYNAGGLVEHTTITGVRNNPLSGSGNGVGIYAYNADSAARGLTVSNNTVVDYEKNGMALLGSGLTIHVTDNTVTGAGNIATLAQNGIQAGYPGMTTAGDITGNTISGNAWIYPGSGTQWVASSILNYYGDIDVIDNTVTGAQVGLYDYDGAGTISGNTFEVVQTTPSYGGYGIIAFDPPGAVPSPYDVQQQVITKMADGPEPAPLAVTITNNDFSVPGADYADSYGIVAYGGYDTGDLDVSISSNTFSHFGLALGFDQCTSDCSTGGLSSDTPLGNTFEDNDIQVTAPDGLIDIAATLSGNTYDRAVTVEHSAALLSTIWGTIQGGVDAAVSGDIVHVNAGTYIENIVIPTPLELAGANQATTIIKPAVSNPNCGSSGSGNAGGSLCAGGSNVILVQADDVLIHHFTIDGDNPDLTSPYDVGGANLDARNGLITNHLLGLYNGLEVHHVTVQNIFLRGMYASSEGSFNFHDNAVTNVRAVYESIAMFAYGGPGTMQNNAVSYAGDAISANWSKGIQFIGNTVTNSGSGVHTDNAGSHVGDTPDLLQGNIVSNCDASLGGYGVWVFAPYLAPTVDGNVITNCQYGLMASGQNAAVTPVFTNNTVNGPANAAGSIGALLTTDMFGWGYTNVAATFTGNIIKDNETGVLLDADAPHSVNATFHCDQITGNTTGVDKGSVGTYTNDFIHNWWGTALGPAAPDNPSGTGNPVVAGINYSPWSADTSCSVFVPPFDTTTAILSDTPEPSAVNELVTIKFRVVNDLSVGPEPTGTVDVDDGSTEICSNVALDDTGRGVCYYPFPAAGSFTLTATFTPTVAGAFNTSSDTAPHEVVSSSVVEPHVRFLPPEGEHVCLRPELRLTLWLTDYMRTDGKFDPTSVSVLLDGTDMLPDSAIMQNASGPASIAEIIYTPDADMPLGTHTVELTFDSATGVQTMTWTFEVDTLACASAAPASSDPSISRE
jgi:hypothetical protein